MASASFNALKQAAARIFGNTWNPSSIRTGSKVLNRPVIGDQLVEYYPETIRALTGDFVDPTVSRAVRKARNLRNRGKGAPKKGQGKRAARKK
jgi:small subunit ribosomal protein S33